MVDGQLTHQKGQSGSNPIPPSPFDGARVQRERITKQDIDEFGATIGCPGCNAIRDNKRSQAHSDRCRRRIEEKPQEDSAWSREVESDEKNVINEALAEEVRRGEQRKKETERVAAAASGVKSTVPGMTAESAPADGERILLNQTQIQREGYS